MSSPAARRELAPHASPQLPPACQLSPPHEPQLQLGTEPSGSRPEAEERGLDTGSAVTRRAPADCHQSGHSSSVPRPGQQPGPAQGQQHHPGWQTEPGRHGMDVHQPAHSPVPTHTHLCPQTRSTQTHTPIHTHTPVHTHTHTHIPVHRHNLHTLSRSSQQEGRTRHAIRGGVTMGPSAQGITQLRHACSGSAHTEHPA